MAATAAQITRVRALVGETAETSTFSDLDLAGYIEAYPLSDVQGQEPTYIDTSTIPGIVTANPYWIETYDLNAAAAEVWCVKAGQVAIDYSTNIGGQSLSRKEVFDNYTRLAAYYRSRRAPRSAQVRSALAIPTWPDQAWNGGGSSGS
jgi:hypothetical protein